jgi:hypothetical protein
MKFFITCILTALLSFSWALFFPWWIIAVAAFIVAALIPQQRFKSFISAFLALFFLWGGQAVLIDTKNAHVLSKKIASVLPFGGSYVALLLVTALIGGLIAGLAALTASFLRTPAITNERKYYNKKITISKEEAVQQ